MHVKWQIQEFIFLKYDMMLNFMFVYSSRILAQRGGQTQRPRVPYCPQHGRSRCFICAFDKEKSSASRIRCTLWVLVQKAQGGEPTFPSLFYPCDFQLKIGSTPSEHMLENSRRVS